jgi:hypothetical protein
MWQRIRPHRISGPARNRASRPHRLMVLMRPVAALTWLWKDNPAGVFEDWNPAVRLCPAVVPIFVTDRPAPSSTP